LTSILNSIIDNNSRPIAASMEALQLLLRGRAAGHTAAELVFPNKQIFLISN
jgi:hypothetical protein